MKTLVPGNYMGQPDGIDDTNEAFSRLSRVSIDVESPKRRKGYCRRIHRDRIRVS